MNKILYTFLALAVLISCEDTIDIDLRDAPSALVIDAFVNDLDQPQIIRITSSQPYFEQGRPQGVEEATVSITDSEGNTFIFGESATAGEYVWDPDTAAIAFGEIGNTYQLNVNVAGEQYIAISAMNRVPVIDSIVFDFKESNPFREEGFYAEFVARDFEGEGDAYWIKAFKNGKFLNNPFELTVAFDAGFSQGGNIDGQVFIQPIQEAVNEISEEIDEIIPYVDGDSLNVEIHSLTTEAFFFFTEVQLQTQRDGGFDEIFTEPLENVVTNIQKVNPDNEEVVQGFFSVSAVQSNGRKLIE